jgi:hypothetical protein
MSLAPSSTGQSSQEGFPLSTGEITWAPRGPSVTETSVSAPPPASAGLSVTSPRSTTLQGWGQEGLSCSHTHYFLPGRVIGTPLSPPQGGWPLVYQGWPQFFGPHHAGGMGPGPYLQEQQWGSYLLQGDSKMVTTISTALGGQRGGVSTLASSSQHPAGGNLTTTPHHSGWKSGGYLGHPSWKLPPSRATPLLGFPPGLSRAVSLWIPGSWFSHRTVLPKVSRFQLQELDPKASASAVKPQGSTGHPILPQNLCGLNRQGGIRPQKHSVPGAIRHV